jgi:hypothetical protein
MKARQRVEFTSVELAAAVEKDAASPMEKVVAGSRALEGRGVRVAQWRRRKMGYCALAWWRCRLAERRGGGEGGAVENVVTEAMRAHDKVWSSRQHGRVTKRGHRGGAGVRRRFMR